MMELLERVKIRLTGENVEDLQLLEMIQAISDRLCIRLGEETLPAVFTSICVDAVVKMYRRVYYEGISSEGTANITTSFVDNILAEYADEIELYRKRQSDSCGSGKVVHFL